MSKYDELRVHFIIKHEHADEFVYKDDGKNTPVKAIYYAPDPNADYEGIDKLLKEINGESTAIDPIDKVISAFTDKGNNPNYHDDQARHLETHWPALYFAVKELVENKGNK